MAAASGFEIALWFGIIALAVFTILVVGVGLVVASLSGAAAISWKSKRTEHGKPIAAVLAILVCLILLVEVVHFEVLTDAIDSSALEFPIICTVHYAFPLHLILTDDFENCYVKAAIYQKNPATCPRYNKECVRAAIDAGGRDCTGVVGIPADDCWHEMALETGNASYCDRMTQTIPESCIEDAAISAQDAAVCEHLEKYEENCVRTVLRETGGNATCEHLSNETLREYCLLLKGKYSAMLREDCQGTAMEQSDGGKRCPYPPRLSPPPTPEAVEHVGLFGM